MPGKRRSEDKAGDRKRSGGGGAGGDMAALFGLGMYGGGDDGGDDADLEAELAALEGKDSGSKKGGKKDKKAAMSAREIDAMLASAKNMGEGGESGDEEVPDEELDEEDLIKQLAELEDDGVDDEGGEDEVNQILPAIPKNGSSPSKQAAPGGKESQLDMVAARLKMYEGALSDAKSKGDSTKERRYVRSIATLNAMVKQAKAGKPVNMEELPPPVSAGASNAAGKKGDAGGESGRDGGGEGGDDGELDSWVNQHQANPTQSSPVTKPKPSPRGSVTPNPDADQATSKPTPSPRGSVTPNPGADQATSKPTPSPRGSVAPDVQAAQGGDGGTLQTVLERTALYKQALSEAQGAGDASKVRRYKRGLETLEEMVKNVKAKRPVNMEDLPPVVIVKTSTPGPSAVQAVPLNSDPPVAMVASQPSAAAPKPQPQPRAQPKPPPNMIDLNAPEFDEFNISEADLATFSNSFVDDRAPKQEIAPAEKPKQVSPSTAPKPQPHAQPKPPPNMIDLNAPEFDEFNISEADLAAFANSFVDDRAPKQEIAPQQPTTSTALAPDRAPQVKVTMSLPAQLPTKDVAKALLEERRTQYLAAMKDAKAQGKEDLAKEYGKTAVQFKKIQGALEQGQPVDLSQMPGPPEGFTSTYSLDTSLVSQPAREKAPPPPGQTTQPSVPLNPQGAPGGEAGEEADPVDPSVPVPKTPLEALEQRLAKYKEAVESATQKGDGSRARRNGRIVKQYEDAIKLTKAGKPVDYEELPAPPGYPPIPVKQGAGGAVRAAQQQHQQALPLARPTQSLPAMRQPAATAPVQKLHPSVSDVQLQVIQQRSQELKMAAKEAQGKGDKETAIKYMHLFKGVQTMLEAAQGGLPVDMSQLPSSPYANLSATKPSATAMAHLKPAAEGDGTTFDLIEKQLERQKELCSSNAATYDEMGNTATALQYKNMCESCEKELLAIKGIRSKGLSPPKFTMETRKFSIVHSNVHLGSNQCEVTVLRGLDIQTSLAGCDGKDLNVCVELEFPLPSESPQKASLTGVRGSQSPEINSTKLFMIDRKSLRNIQRVIKRSPLTCTLYHRRTLRKDIFLGVAHVSLEQLDTKSEVKSCFDLLDEKGKKPVGGKLEVMVRLREPLSCRDEEEKEEQWLVFDEPIAAPSQVSMPKAAPVKKQGAGEAYHFVVDIAKTTSMEALKFEYTFAQKLKSGDPAVAQRLKLIQGRLGAIKQRYQTDSQFQQKYPVQVRLEIRAEQQLEQKCLAEGKATDVRILQLRRQVMEKELQSLEQK